MQDGVSPTASMQGPLAAKTGTGSAVVSISVSATAEPVAEPVDSTAAEAAPAVASSVIAIAEHCPAALWKPQW